MKHTHFSVISSDKTAFPLPEKFHPLSYEARNRILLYTRGMALSPLESISLAYASFEHIQDVHAHVKAEDTTQGFSKQYMRAAMQSLHAQLEERKILFQLRTQDGKQITSTPPMTRCSMLSEKLERNIFLHIWKYIQGVVKHKCSTSSEQHTHAQDQTAKKHKHEEEKWVSVVKARRFFLLLLTVIPSLLAGAALYSLFAETMVSSLLFISSGLFTILFFWISVGFWNFMAGIAVIWRASDTFSFSHSVPKDVPLPHNERTALLFPIYNEDAKTVCAGIKTVWQSLREQGIEKHFDIFILSDSTKADAWVNEEEAWYALCLSENAHEHIFYRRRKMNLKRKSGNIADFCRRFGKQYRYMVIFDADSLMSAQSLKRLVQIMESNPHIGIVQSLPRVIKSTTLLARVQQFSNHLYGPIFAAGLNFWRLGNTQYWGHNAIIRVEPFIRHCQLSKLPGKAPLGGEILSHDFVESALMRRAGYGVWLDYDMDGSFEQSPPSLIDELIRDRRWCQGNLQHSKLLFTEGFFPTHRALFANGIMSYVSAFLWLLFLLSSSVQVIMELFIVPDYFASEISLLPQWPQFFPHWLLTLMSCTAALLFLPKIFAIVLVQIQGGAKAFGGVFSMLCSVICEVFISTLLAPVRMLFHSTFVISSLLGYIVSWNPQNRINTGTSWADAVRFHWWGTALGSFWGWFMYMANPDYFLWISPIVMGLAFSIPLSVWSSKESWGNAVKSLGLFLTPPEIEPSHELRTFEKNLDDSACLNPFDIPLKAPKNAGFIRAVVIHFVLSLHISLNAKQKRPTSAIADTVEKAVNCGPDALSNAEKILLLHNSHAMVSLHHKVWASDAESALRWGIDTK